MEQLFNWETFLWTTLGAFLTLATFSFLYKDNPLYKIAEHLVVGVSAGYFTVLLYYTSLRGSLIDHIFVEDTWTLRASPQWWYIVPAILGILMWTRFSRKWTWVSRYPIAFYFGIATGTTIPLEMKNRVNEQINATIFRLGFDFTIDGYFGVPKGIWDVVLVIGVISALIYFFFSKEHKGVFGGVARIGIYTLMIGFGASFGYTVMARISLFIQRLQDLRDWMMMIPGIGGS